MQSEFSLPVMKVSFNFNIETLIFNVLQMYIGYLYIININYNCVHKERFSCVKLLRIFIFVQMHKLGMFFVEYQSCLLFYSKKIVL